MRGQWSERLREGWYRQVLAGGMPFYLLRKPGFFQKSALLAVDFGSLDRQMILPGGEEQVALPAGIAHFLEHQMFHKPEGNIAEQFANLGAEIEADTTFTHTTYSCSGVHHFEESLKLLMELVFRPHFAPDEVAREREIIAREIQLSGDHLEWNSYFAALDTLYAGQPLATDIAGTLESLEQIDGDLLARCYQTFYQPANMALFVCGDLDPGALGELVETHLSRLSLDGRMAGRRFGRQVLAPTDPERRRMVLPVVLPHRCLAFADRKVGLWGTPLLRRELALELTLDILFGPASRFYCRRYEEGLIEAGSFGFETNVESWFSFCLISGEAREPERLVEAILEELRQARRNASIAADFERSWRKSYGHLLQGFDQVEESVQLMHSAVSCGAEPFDFLTAHELLTEAEVSDCLETCLDPERYGLVLIEPSG